jgi:hypothetical protein
MPAFDAFNSMGTLCVLHSKVADKELPEWEFAYMRLWGNAARQQLVKQKTHELTTKEQLSPWIAECVAVSSLPLICAVAYIPHYFCWLGTVALFCAFQYLSPTQSHPPQCLITQ